MYTPELLAAAAAREIIRDDLPPVIDKIMERDLDHDDASNGRVDCGLLPVYRLLRANQWPTTAAERDELLRRWDCSARSLYQWRREVLLCFEICRLDHLQ